MSAINETIVWEFFELHGFLVDLIARAEVNRNYDKSDLLPVIRVLKNYQLFKDPQMELFRGARRAKRPRCA